MKLHILALSLLAAVLAPPAAQAFSWSSCPSTGIVTLQTLSLFPIPVEFGQPVTAQARWELRFEVTPATGLSVAIEHRVNGRLLPCLGPLQGSCTFQDICPAVQEAEFDSCEPLGATAASCSCPFAVGTYSYSPTSPLEVNLTDDGERFLGQNEYSVRAYRQVNGPAVLEGCVDVQFEVVRCEDPPCVPGEPCDPKYCLQ